MVTSRQGYASRPFAITAQSYSDCVRIAAHNSGPTRILGGSETPNVMCGFSRCNEKPEMAACLPADAISGPRPPRARRAFGRSASSIAQVGAA